MAATFLQAMTAAYDAIGSTVPTIYGEGIPDSVVSYPRAELNHMGEVPTYSRDGTVEMTTGRCQVCIYDTTLVSVDNLSKTVRDELTPDCLTIANTTNRLWRQNYRAYMDPERTNQQRPIFAGVTEYMCEMTGG